MTKSDDRKKIDERLDELETAGYYGSLEVKAQNGRLIYLRKELTEPLSGSSKKK